MNHNKLTTKQRLESLARFEKGKLARDLEMSRTKPDPTMKLLAPRPLKIENQQIRTLLCGAHEEGHIFQPLQKMPHIWQRIYEKTLTPNEKLERTWIRKFKRNAKDRKPDITDMQDWFAY